ncbi:hypothetical protein DM01DRAFT_1334380 [Hesseltinella vesiculosa]|uniref:G-patch domain-containing protein n=1 Tax=Hesseltinella vesiculosa TaxID=101127 RepID=A0A1X2GLV0_9FUNG|nr:hypothetical protein DM01DRAFT_1334380 [Hesseltinella vesiculosa]
MQPIAFVKCDNSNGKSAHATAQDPATTTEELSGDQVSDLYQSIVMNAHSTPPNNAPLLDDTPGALTTYLYCDTCEMDITGPEHYQSLAHLIGKQQHGDPLPSLAGSFSPQTKANVEVLVSRLQLEHGKEKALDWMRKQGWQDGQGLGKTNQGAPFALATTFKQDRLGVGHPNTDRRTVTHPSITKTRSVSVTSSTAGSIASQTSADAAHRQALLRYMKQ